MHQTITDFKSHTDNINEIISAEHVNVIHEAVNEVEETVTQTVKEVLHSKAMQVFMELGKSCMNVLSANESYRMDSQHSYGVEVQQGYQLILKDGADKGTYVSTPIVSHLSDDAVLKSFLLLTDVIHHENIEFGLLTEAGDYYPFDEQGVCELREAVKSFRIQVALTQTSNGESPIVQLLAVYYEDLEVKKGLSHLIQGE